MSEKARPGMSAKLRGYDCWSRSPLRRSMSIHNATPRVPDHFDLICGKRIDRNEMVFAEIGGAARADAIFDDPYAIDVETPDDRATGSARCKARAGDARFGEQHVAKLRSTLPAEFLVRYHRHGCKLVGHDRQNALLRGGCCRSY